MGMVSHYLFVLDADRFAMLRALEIMKSNKANIPEKAHILISHNLHGYWIWKSRLTEVEKQIEFWSKIPLDNLEQEINNTYDDWKQWISAQKEDFFDKKVEYKDLAGNSHSNSITEILAHITHHSAYHRGQIMSALKDAGFTILPTDYIVYARSKKA